MTTRRKFIQGAVSAAVAAALPGGDGVALYSATHPSFPTANSDINPLKYMEQGPAPKFIFNSDPNTGFYGVSGDHLRLVVGGVRRLSSLEEIEIEIDVK